GKGTNCVGVMLGNSFWSNPNPPPGRYNKQGPQRKADEPFLLCAEIRLEGSRGSIATDETWRAADGPVVFSHVYAGEDYDARKESRGWDRAGFDDHAWQPARLASAPPGRLEPMTWPGIKTFEREGRVSVKQPASGVFLYSFPRNTAAQLRVELAGGKA